MLGSRQRSGAGAAGASGPLAAATPVPVTVGNPPNVSHSNARPAARGRRALLVFLLGMLVILLLVDGFTTKTVGASNTGDTTTVAASPLAGQNPVLVSDGHGGLVSHQPAPGKRIALTFDDGPGGPTLQIAQILMAEHVPATFFEVGSQVVRHASVTRKLYRDGFELGNHTFTHADPAGLPNWERQVQISLTESAIAGVTGIRPRLVRPPYSSTTDAVTPGQEKAWGTIAQHGYTIVLSNFDTNDWDQPGVNSIVASVVDNLHNGQGGIVLMHDGGGRRVQTVQALPLLIAALRQRGYSFATVSGLAGIPLADAEVPASGAQHVRGQAFDEMLAVAGWVTNALTRVVEAITILVALRMLLGLILARVQIARTRGRKADPGFTPPVSILVPAYNEAVGIERSVRSLSDSRYAGELEVIVVDDGSTDDTAAILEGLALPNVRVLRQANAGKAAALNRALAASHHDVIVTVDGDTVFEPQTLSYLVQRFREPDVGAISGNTKVGNRTGIIGRWQHIEYVMGFNLDRRMYEVLGCTPTVPGAIGAFRRRALADIGGVSGATLAEDTDITIDIGRAGWNVVYEERARAWTEAPSTVRALYRQRSRWAYGTLQSMWKHRQALWRRDQGRVATRAIPYLTIFQVLLPLAAPLIDLFAIYSIVFLDPWPILGFWLAFNGFQFLLAWFAFGFDGESRRVLWALPLQQFVHRQIMYLVVYDAIISALLGTRLSWQRAERTGGVEIA